MYKKIMIVVDESEVSKAAMLEGVAFAKANNSEVVFFHVLSNYVLPIDDEFSVNYVSIEDYRNAVERAAVKLLNAATAQATKHGVKSTVSKGSGADAAEVIAESAAKLRCNLIVVGSHGHTALQRLVFGSVVTRLITFATMPVLVCKKLESRSVQPSVAVAQPRTASRKLDKKDPRRRQPVVAGDG